ncbi:hypothetical protein C2869_17420 [Saccharobesus litoralis]|uniref:Uncharacterized protein n=1 Tax=Saccharobesus litoralis TaxID=2172099 RepID=A0A2S0VV48_9ALTE|nr:hypothetical protein [Saccharobesus litoralis]AWB68091.1 hypothetical protein C2869_17420 [Saccharobesus litoralis]
MHHLSQQFINKCSLALSQLQAEVLQQIYSKIQASNVELAQFIDKPISSLSAEQQLELFEQHFEYLLKQELPKLRNILTAESQLDIGLYGICPYCESEMTPEALSKNPAIQTCCQCCKECEKCRD